MGENCIIGFEKLYEGCMLRKIRGFVCPLMQPGISRRIHDARLIPPTVLRSEGDGNYL